MSESLGGELVLADRYELAGLISRSATAEVHRAHDRLLDRGVAVKIFDSAARHRFDDEARALARVAHPGLVAIFDVGTAADRPFLVMEYVEGASLRSRLLDGPLPVDQVLRIGGTLADALAHAHERGVVHHAVRPSNVVFDLEDLPRLIDFGVALLTGSAQDDEAGPPSDVYTLGSMLLECLSGEAELPPDIADLLTAMTSTEIRDRPTAQTCASRLLAAVADATTDVEPPVQTSVVDGPLAWWTDEDRTARVPIEPAVAVRSGPRWRLLTASVAGIAVVLAALVFMFHSPLQRTYHPQTEAADHGHSGSSTSPTTGADRVGTTHGPRAPRSAPSAGTLIVHEHPAGATTRPPVAAPRKSHPTPVTTPALAPPPQTVVPTPSPPTTPSEPSAPTSTSAAPPSTNGGGPGPGNPPGP